MIKKIKQRSLRGHTRTYKNTVQFPFCSLLFPGSKFPQGSNLLTGIIAQDSFLKCNHLLTTGRRKGRLCPSNWEVCGKVRVVTNLLILAFCIKTTCTKGICIFFYPWQNHAKETIKITPSPLQLKKKQTKKSPVSFTNIPPTFRNTDKHNPGLTTLGRLIIRTQCHWATCSECNKPDHKLTSIDLALNSGVTHCL